MTCIIGYVENGKITMGGDSAGVREYFSVQRADEKVFIVGEFLFGICGSFRAGNLIRYKWTVPDRTEGMTEDEYIHTAFIDSIIALLRKNHNARVENNETGMETRIMVGYRGKLYTVEEDFQIAKTFLPFWSIGCGAYFALGALHALEIGKYPSKTKAAIDKLTPKERIAIALNAACEFSGWVKEPFIIKTAP